MAALLAGQSVAPSEDVVEDSGLIIATESNLAVVPLHVYKKKGSIGGLGVESFELLEDGVKQKIAFVEGPPASDSDISEERSMPVEIIFLIDVSHSVMRRGLLDPAVVRSSLLEGLRENVTISIYGFAEKLTRFSGPTNDIDKLKRALDMAYAAEDGHTLVYESIVGTLRDVGSRKSNASRIMLVFSDGMSTTGLGWNWAAQASQIFGVPIYPVVWGINRSSIGQRAHRALVKGRVGRPHCIVQARVAAPCERMTRSTDKSSSPILRRRQAGTAST